MEPVARAVPSANPSHRTAPDQSLLLRPCRSGLGLLASSKLLGVPSVRFFRGRCFAGRWFLLTAVLFGANAFAGVASAFGATIADWQMNEPPGATTMLDSSGSNLSGAIGSAVETGVVLNGETAYRWVAANKDGYHPERLVTVQSSLLNPGTDAFAVTVLMRTGAGDQNIIQKGQANTVGGMFKIDMVKGIVICMYKGSEGRSSIRSTQPVWDKLWHVIRCERRPTGVTLTIDGGTPRTNLGATGKIANTWALSIGGKWKCNPPDVQCDYYVGLISRVLVERLEPTDATKPVVELTEPPDGSSVKRGTSVGMAATASDDVGVTKVDFKVNGSLKCSVTVEPYTCSWTAWTAVGTKNTVRAIAYDAAGNSASDTVYVYTE